MKLRRSSLAMVALASGLLLGISRIQGVQADDRHDGPCSNKTLNGSYGFYRTGSTPTGPLVAIGIATFDEEGNSSSIQTISRNGVFTFDVPGSGEYEVSEDCTAKGFRDGVEGIRYVIVDGGNEIYALSEMAGNMIYLVGKKIHTRRNGDDR